MSKRYLFLYLPLAFLLVLGIVLYIPQFHGIPVIEELDFMEKTTLFAAFAFASFASIEGYATFDRSSFELKRHRIEDARNELEKAYGPLYSMLNKNAGKNNGKNSLWLDHQERERIDEIMATYPFMFTTRINEFWQNKIRNLGENLETDFLNSKNNILNMDAYGEFRKIINEEYIQKVNNYNLLLKK